MLSVSTMTAQRQEMNGWRRIFALIGLVAGLALGAFSYDAGSFDAKAATTQRIVTNRYTGLAIGGVDPVAYFTDRRMVQGDSKLELAQGGAIWRFRNADNRAY